ncbi:TonB-dependent receptor [bacterium]|jgi:vitamin B12 transporter|nr:TonB-dependent receptor [bacterium]
MEVLMGIRVSNLLSKSVIIGLLVSVAPTVPWAQSVQIAPDVVVSATRVETPAEQVGSSITVFTAKDIEERNPQFVEDILRFVPGVDVGQTSGNPGGLTQVRIRGSEANHTLVIIDGVEVNRPNVSNEFDFFALRPEDIERIEVLRGPQTALYGSEAVGGVINIITKIGTGKPEYSLTQEFGSYFTRNTHVSARAGGKIAKGFGYNARISGSAFRTKGISAATIGAEADPSDIEDGNAKLGLNYKKIAFLDLVGRFTRSDVKNDKSDGDQVGINAVDDGTSTNSRDRYGRAQIRLNLFEGIWKQKFGVSATHNVIHSKNASGVTTFRNEGKKTILDYQSVLNAETKKIVNADHTLVLGYENEDDRLKNDSSFGNSIKEVNSNNVYFNYQLGLAKRFFFTGGSQLQYSKFFPNVDIEDSYRFTAAYLHRETKTKIKGAIGRGIKNPTLFELFGSSDNFSGNPNLKPESTESWEIGVEQSFLKNKLKFEAVYFDNQVDNLITGSSTTSKNIKGVSIHGVEFSMKAKPHKDVDVITNYTWMTSEQKSGADVGSELVRRPKHKANMNVIYRFLQNKANAGINLTYNGRTRDFDFDRSGGFSFATRTLTTLDSYFLVNLTGSYKFNNNFKLFGRVDNLFNENYEEVFGFGRPGVSGFGGVKLTF